MIFSKAQVPAIHRSPHVFFGLAIILSTAPSGLAATDPPPLSVIVRHVVDRAEDERKALLSMQYDQIVLIDELDESGHAIKHQERKMIVCPGAPNAVQLVSVTGDTMPSDSLRKNRRGGLRENIEQGRQNFSLAKMIDRFDVTFEGHVDLAGQPAYLLGFVPKADQHSDNLVENVLDKLQGQLWISPVNYSVLQAKASLTQDVGAGWIPVTIHRFDFRYNFTGTNVAELGSAQIDILVWATSSVLPPIHQKQKLILSNFTLR